MAIPGNGFIIKVSTETMRSKADTVSGLLEELRAQSEEILKRINRTSSYWEGENGTMRRAEYGRKHRTVERMLQRLKEYPEDLLAMSGIYESSEEENVEYMQPLSADVIL